MAGFKPQEHMTDLKGQGLPRGEVASRVVS